MMGYVLGAGISGGGFVLAKKPGIGFTLIGGLFIIVGLAVIALSVMIDAKKNGAI